MNNSKLKQMANLSGPNSRNHTGPGSTQVQPYNSWFRDTLRSSNQKITMVNTPSRSYRGQALVSMETPSTVYTTPKQTPITARGSKANETMQKDHRLSKKTINDQAAGNILQNGIQVLGDSPMKTIQIDLTPKHKNDPRLSELSTRYQHMLAQSPPASRRSPGDSYMTSRMSNMSGGKKFSRSPKAMPEGSRMIMTYREDPTGKKTIQEWKHASDCHIVQVEQKKIQRHFLRHNSPSVELNTKAKLGYSQRGYRTRECFNKTNQSTNFIQMSPRLVDFKAAMTDNNKRMRKANQQQYTKNILTARRTRAMRETNKFDSSKWEYSPNYLYDKFNGKLDDPNMKNRGITGFTFHPDNEARKLKMRDFHSGNITFDEDKIINGELPENQKNQGITGRKYGPNQKHRRNKMMDMSSIQVIIAEDVIQEKYNQHISGRQQSPQQHSRIQKQKQLSSDIGF